MSSQKPLQTFIAEQSLTATPERVATLPNRDMDEDQWHKDARHWKVRLTAGRKPVRRLTVPFSQGSAHTQAPRLGDVLDCLASDASGVENAKDFEDWCGEYGYDTDSRKAERTYRAVVKQTDALKQWLGEAAYQELLWEVERQ